MVKNKTKPKQNQNKTPTRISQVTTSKSYSLKQLRFISHSQVSLVGQLQSLVSVTDPLEEQLDREATETVEYFHVAVTDIEKDLGSTLWLLMPVSRSDTYHFSSHFISQIKFMA